MSDGKDIAVLGMGRVGTHLSAALRAAGHRVTEIRTHDAAEAARCAAGADLLLLCVQDERLTELNRRLRLTAGRTAVAHVSGATPLQAIADIAPRHGVFYCLQTFSPGDAIDFRQVPICVEASDVATASLLESVARSLSANVRRVDSRQRLALHLAAVFASNYSNLMYSAANQILQACDLDLTLLQPIIEQTAEKLRRMPPLQAQTGPALRHDDSTLEKHRQLLADLPLPDGYRRLYDELAALIQRLHPQP
ncbi:MAG: DUF2520 domain-containing protein [Bacteroidales bacterium]|nr:DUF2520 domain-containing protein [Bacteroidales bacterium]